MGEFISPGELTTPTGAALAGELVDRFEPLPPLHISALGYGAGLRELPGWANVTRALAGKAVSLFANTSAEHSTAQKSNVIINNLIVEQVALLETNIDHRTPEALAFACEELLAAGALDVWQEPITMKKGRLAVCLSVLCAPSETRRLTEELIAQTGSLGVRASLVERAVVSRSPVIIHTAYGDVPFKSALLKTPGAATKLPASATQQDTGSAAKASGKVAPTDGQGVWLRPEHDAVARIARQHNLDYQQLYDEFISLANKTI